MHGHCWGRKLCVHVHVLADMPLWVDRAGEQSTEFPFGSPRDPQMRTLFSAQLQPYYSPRSPKALCLATASNW